LENNLAKT